MYDDYFEPQDPPEEWDEFERRITAYYRFIPEDKIRELYKKQEQAKKEYQKQLAFEAKEHEKTVNALRKQIEMEKRRIEREADQAMRQEERDPTPEFEDPDTTIAIPDHVRDQHIFIPGRTRQGKSSELFRLIIRDIENDHGVAVLDPKGSLVHTVACSIPESRLEDVIYLDLKDPIPLEVMRHAESPEEFVGDLKQMVLKGNTTLERAAPLLTDILYTLLKIPGTSFLDIREWFTDPDREKELMDALETIDPKERKYWRDNKPPKAHYEPLMYRMTDFVRNPSLQTILGPGNGLNVKKAMDDKRIILVDLGGNGEPRQIYGSLLVSQFQQAALSRTGLHPSRIIPFHLFVDEFEEFQTSSFAKILSIAGGLGLRLCVGNQYIGQLTDEIRDAIFGNVGTYIMFHMVAKLDLFTNIIAPYKVKRISELQQHQAIFKVEGIRHPLFAWTKKRPEFSEAFIEQRIADLKASTKAEFRQIRNPQAPPSQTDNSMLQSRDGDDDDPTLTPHTTQKEDS